MQNTTFARIRRNFVFHDSLFWVYAFPYLSRQEYLPTSGNNGRFRYLHFLLALLVQDLLVVNYFACLGSESLELPSCKPRFVLEYDARLLEKIDRN